MQNIPGEFKIVLDGQERTMKANFKAVEKLEREVLKKPIAGIVANASVFNIYNTDLVDIVYVCLAANGDTRLSRDRIGELMLEQGMAFYAETIIKMLTYMLNAGKESPENPF